MIENEVTWPGEHVKVRVGDLLKYDNGSVLRVTKVYPDNWGCDAVDLKTGRECALYQWSLDKAHVKISGPATQTDADDCACVACEAQLPDECGCGTHLCPNCECCDVHCECGYYDQEG